MRKPTPYNQILAILHELHKKFPTYNMGRHIATALDGYGDVWGITDRELFFALEKYSTELDMDVAPHHKDELDKIIKDGMDLDNILKEDEYYE
jgi:hypothetical protein